MTNPLLSVLGNRNVKSLPTESISLTSISYSLDKGILKNNENKEFLNIPSSSRSKYFTLHTHTPH